MLNHFCAHPAEIGPLYLIAGFKDRGSVLFPDDLSRFQAAFHTICTLDAAPPEAAGAFQTGLVTAHIGRVPFRDLGDHRVVIVGPPVMMRFAVEECLKWGADEQHVWLSFERKMSCALGKCGHCKINETYVCLEGPVFNYTQAKSLLD
jgi:anaerobic sulfite reductase subunit B